ncbi:conserved hypothetical protein [Ricinus communis]|uniref:Uncharacterized protein n=1 Tax=Ricinus communis TaxID=3988 RepID=B9S0F7_RICCO|nr:conserved hypothetical protein [Ricinus communis]
MVVFPVWAEKEEQIIGNTFLDIWDQLRLSFKDLPDSEDKTGTGHPTSMVNPEGSQQSPGLQTSIQKVWSPPPTGIVKCNFDGASIYKSSVLGIYWSCS